MFYALYSVLMRAATRSTSASSPAPPRCSSLSVVLAAAGVSVAACLLVLALAPVVTVVGYETLGHRHMADALERL